MRKRYKRLIKNLKEILQRPDMSILPGQLAFSFFLSLVPTLTILFYFAAFLHISLSDVMTYFNFSIDDSILTLITPYIESTEASFGLFILLVVGIYMASNGMNSIIVTANNIYGIEQTPFLERRIKAIIMVFIVIMLLLFILLVPVFGNFLMSLIIRMTGNSSFYDFLSFLKLPFSWFVIFFFIKILYTIAPDKQIPSAYVNLGALFTSISWIVATQVYLYYVGHFANYSLYYSGLSNIAILLILVYILSTVFVIGMGLNYKEESYEIERTQKIRELKNAKKNQHKNDSRKLKY